MKLALKRAYAVVLCALVWTAKDLIEMLGEAWDGYVHLLAALVMLSPVGWVIGLYLNGSKAYRHRKMVTKNTHWFRKRS